MGSESIANLEVHAGDALVVADTTAPSSLLLAVLVAATVAIVASVWRVIVVPLVPSLQDMPPIDFTLRPPRSPPKRTRVLAAVYGWPLEEQHGGGGTDDVNAQSVAVADAIQRRLGEIIKKPGLRAIAAVLRIRAGETQAAAAASTGAGPHSIRKYKPLVATVLDVAVCGAAAAGATALVGPLAAGVVGGAAVAAAVLPPRTQALPNVSSVRLQSEGSLKVGDDRIYRVWAATVRGADGIAHERTTEPVLHEPAPLFETAADARKRENREQHRIVYALRALDEEARAAHRSERNTQDRARYRAKRAQRLAQLPALPVPDGDEAWWLPAEQQPHFEGEQVWRLRPEAPPQLGTIKQLYRDGSAKLALASGGTVSTAPDEPLVRLGVQVPSYVGQRVEVLSHQRRVPFSELSHEEQADLERRFPWNEWKTPKYPQYMNDLNGMKRVLQPEEAVEVWKQKERKARATARFFERDLATVTAVHDDRTVDMQLFNAASGSYDGPVHRRMRVEGQSDSELAPENLDSFGRLNFGRLNAAHKELIGRLNSSGASHLVDRLRHSDIQQSPIDGVCESPEESVYHMTHVVAAPRSIGRPVSGWESGRMEPRTVFYLGDGISGTAQDHVDGYTIERDGLPDPLNIGHPDDPWAIQQEAKRMLTSRPSPARPPLPALPDLHSLAIATDDTAHAKRVRDREVLEHPSKLLRVADRMRKWKGKAQERPQAQWRQLKQCHLEWQARKWSSASSRPHPSPSKITSSGVFLGYGRAGPKGAWD